MLEGLFAYGVVCYSDGGGMVRAARKPVVGGARVAKFVAAFASHLWTGVTLSASAEGIEQLLWILRPSKLAADSPSIGAT